MCSAGGCFPLSSKKWVNTNRHEIKLSSSPAQIIRVYEPVVSQLPCQRASNELVQRLLVTAPRNESGSAPLFVACTFAEDLHVCIVPYFETAIAGSITAIVSARRRPRVRTGYFVPLRLIVRIIFCLSAREVCGSELYLCEVVPRYPQTFT